MMHRSEAGMATPIKVSAMLFVSLGILAAYLSLGAVPLPLSDIIETLYIAVTEGESAARDAHPKVVAILFYIQGPRALAAILAGGGLALAGASMQGLFKNPMASPDIMGISAGSSLGAVIAISLGVASIHPLMIPGFSIVGGLLTAAFVFALAGRAGVMQLLFLILAGLAVSSLLGGAVSAVLMFSQEYEISQFIFWTMGGLEGRMWQHIVWPGPIMIVIALLTVRLGQSLNVLSLGEENAHGMGLPVSRIKFLVLLYTALLTSLAISMAGPIGFVGLMVPHFVRLVLGPDHRTLLPLSMIVGAVFVLLCDLIGRWMIAPYEIRVGVITSIVGGSYFVFLIIRYYRMGRLLT